MPLLTGGRKHLADGSLVLCDVTSTYFEGAELSAGDGCPLAVEVFEEDTAGLGVLGSQPKKLCVRFGLSRVVVVGDRGLLTSARIREEVKNPALFTRGGVKGVACGGEASRFKVLRREPATCRSLRRGEDSEFPVPVQQVGPRRAGFATRWRSWCGRRACWRHRDGGTTTTPRRCGTIRRSG